MAKYYIGQKTHPRLTFDQYKVLGIQPFPQVISTPLWYLIGQNSLPSSFNSVKLLLLHQTKAEFDFGKLLCSLNVQLQHF